MERKNQSWQDSMQKIQGQHSKAALVVRYKTDAVHPEPTALDTLRPPSRAAQPEERPLQGAQTAQDIRTWTDT